MLRGDKESRESTLVVPTACSDLIGLKPLEPGRKVNLDSGVT